MKRLVVWFSSMAIGMAVTIAPLSAEMCHNHFGFRHLQKLANAERPPSSTASLEPVIVDLMGRLAQSYGCQSLVNFYASQMGLESDLVKKFNVSNGTIVETRFGNNLYPALCGTFTFNVPEDRAAREFFKKSTDEFTKGSTDVYNKVDNLVQHFLPSGSKLPAPSTENLIDAIKAFQLSLTDKFREFAAGQAGSATEFEQFIDRTRCSALLPNAISPDVKALSEYRSAYQAFQSYVMFLEQGLKR